MSVKEHYDKHLADFYSWMIGDFNRAKESFKEFCEKNGIKPDESGIAIDLGAGNGIQSLALAEIGFNVKAVDFNEKLLAELKSKIGGLAIEPIKDTIVNVRKIAGSPVDLIVCCGDTIAHLDSFEQLDNLIRDCYDLLKTNGKLILSFRDYSVALSDTQRFIPVKADDQRILTCVIDFSENKVTVTDLLHEKKEGIWSQKISSYQKLRLRTDNLINTAENVGFTVIEKEDINRMIHLVLKK